MKIEVEVEKLTNYLKLVQGVKSGKVDEVLVEVTLDGLLCIANDTPKSRFVKAVMKKTEFTHYQASEGDYIAHQNLETLLTILGRFNKTVQLVNDGNKLQITQKGRKAVVVMPSKDIISDAVYPKVPFTHTFEAPVAIFKEAIANARAVGEEIYEVEVKDKKISISVGNKDVTYFVEEAEVNAEPIRVQYKEGFQSMFEGIDGNVLVSMKDKAPIQTEHTKGGIVVTNIVAPFIEV